MFSPKSEDKYPDLYLPVAENYRISDRFYGYTDSVSVDNNPIILVELTGLCYRYGSTIYAVDRVNGTKYGRFSRGCRMTSERATVKPQYKDTPLTGMYGPAQPMHMRTLLGTTQMVTPLAKSTPVTQFSQIPVMIPNRMPPVRDILEPTSNEQARADYFERQMRHMGSMSRLLSDILPPEVVTQRQDITQRPQSREATPQERYGRNRDQQETGAVTHDSLQRRVQEYC